MNYAHPYKYCQGFRSQLDRLERLYPGVTCPVSTRPYYAPSLSIEDSGANSLDLARRRRRLQHLDNLIADWRIDGETIHSAVAGRLSSADSDVTIAFDDIPPPVTYLQFDADEALNLGVTSGRRIEGCYLREVMHQGQVFVELTVVCDEIGWATMNSCLYADAMEIGARISVGMVPLAQEISAASAVRLFNGDPALNNESSLAYVLLLAKDFVASVNWKACSASHVPLQFR